MKNYIPTAILLFIASSMFAQIVQVDGKLKVMDMDTSNEEELLVVKQSNGTLATRQIASLPLSTGDTSRTLLSDLLLTVALCSCASLPSSTFQLLLDNGYTLEDLLEFPIPVADILAFGITPMELYQAGLSLDSLYGQNYEGGGLFYLDTADVHPFEGLISSGANRPFQDWGCETTLIEVTSMDIGTGQANTTAIINAGCPDAPTAAITCDDLVLNNYEDWYLPSLDELNLMWLNLAANNLGNLNPFPYWSSTEFFIFNVFTDAYIVDMADGDESVRDKGLGANIRAIRSY